MPTESYAPFFARIALADPTLDLRDAVVNVDGLVNVVIICGGRVFRFARDEQSARSLAQEIKTVALASQYLRLPIPAFEVIEPDFVTYPLLLGQPLVRNEILQLAEGEKDHLACQLAEFLMQLHAIPQEQLQEAQIGRSGGPQSRAGYLDLYESVRQELFPLMYRSTREWAEAQFAPLLEQSGWLDHQPCLIHDDLASYHILYDPQRVTISGVIDFGTAGQGDPARDYALLIKAYGESFVRRMATYDERIRAFIDRARFYAGTLELSWVLAGIRSGDSGWFTAHLDGARDIQPYGNRL